jgi:hypothetical protein
MDPPDDELRALRERVEILEREHQQQISRANAAIAAAQDRSYWLDRWHLDLNALMRTRAGRALNSLLELLLVVYRRLRK